MKTNKEKLERIVKFAPAWDKRSPNPKKNYGINTMQCFMLVKGKKGVTHFVFSTGILLPKTIEEYIKNGKAKYELHDWGYYFLNKPMGFDVGYHARKKQYKGQELRHPTRMVKTKGNKPFNYKFPKIGKKPPVCEWIGKPCYCDGSALRAETFMDILTEKGDEPIWKMLEEDYKLLK